MKLAIIGFSGNVGKRLVDEALRRGHAVTGISRNSAQAEARPGLAIASGDANDPAALAPVLRGQDAVISSVPFRSTDQQKLVEAVRLSGVKRYLVVGGAGSLEIAPGKLLIDSPQFPEVARLEASRGKAALDTLRGVQDLEWTMLSPSALFTKGERTGSFRLGKDTLLTAADGKSWISYEDFAIALLDEIENPKNVRSRFTIGY